MWILADSDSQKVASNLGGWFFKGLGLLLVAGLAVAIVANFFTEFRSKIGPALIAFVVTGAIGTWIAAANQPKLTTALIIGGCVGAGFFLLVMMFWHWDF